MAIEDRIRAEYERAARRAMGFLEDAAAGRLRADRETELQVVAIRSVVTPYGRSNSCLDLSYHPPLPNGSPGWFSMKGGATLSFEVHPPIPCPVTEEVREAMAGTLEDFVKGHVNIVNAIKIAVRLMASAGMTEDELLAELREAMVADVLEA